MIEEQIKQFESRLKEWQMGELGPYPKPPFSLTQWLACGRAIEDYPGINEPDEMLENNECNL